MSCFDRPIKPVGCALVSRRGESGTRGVSDLREMADTLTMNEQRRNVIIIIQLMPVARVLVLGLICGTLKLGTVFFCNTI